MAAEPSQQNISILSRLKLIGFVLIQLTQIAEERNKYVQTSLQGNRLITVQRMILLDMRCTGREFFREILYKNIAIIAIQHSNMYFVDTSGDFSHTVG